MTAEVLHLNDSSAQRSEVPASREPAQPSHHVSGFVEVCPYEANVIGETIEKNFATEEKTQKESKGLREKICVIEILLLNLIMEFNHHFKVLAELGFPEIKPFINPKLLFVILGGIFLAEIPLNATMLEGMGFDDTEVYVVAVGMALWCLLVGKAMANAIRRLESGDPDRRKESAMSIAAGIGTVLALVAMAIARQSYGEQLAATGNGGMSNAMAIGLLLLQLAFFIGAVYVAYIALPRDRQAAASRSICTCLSPKIMKLAEQREKYSSRYNAIQRTSMAKVEQQKAFARRLISEYFEELHTRGGGNLGQAAPWQESWFPPLSLGAPLEEHPPLLQDTLAKIASFHKTK